MRILVCDDEISALDKTEEMLDDIFNSKLINTVIHKSDNPEEVIASDEMYDMAFLDIEMGNISGIRLAEVILERNPHCLVFFITNYSTYLDDAFDINAFRYLNKPLCKERLEKSVTKALERIEDRSRTITLTKKPKLKFEVSVTSIIYIENSNRHTYVVTRDNAFIADEPFAKVKELIMDVSDSFTDTHQSFFVNLKYVSYYDNTKVKLSCGGNEYEVHMSRRKYADFDDRMFLEANKQRW